MVLSAIANYQIVGPVRPRTPHLSHEECPAFPETNLDGTPLSWMKSRDFREIA